MTNILCGRELTEAEIQQRHQAQVNAKLFADLLACYLAEHFSYKRNYVSVGLAPTVCARTDKYDLYFRVMPADDFWGHDTLVIARIGFKQSRRGHGRRLMAFLVECADCVGYSKIGIESINNDSEAFGAKFGLSQYKNGNHLKGSVDQIKAHLSRGNTAEAIQS